MSLCDIIRIIMIFFFYLQVAKFSSRLMFKANFSEREVSIQDTIKTRLVKLIQGKQSIWEMLN